MIHAQKETEFLRLKRTRLGLSDFEMLKIIGRGAFGEVFKLKIMFLLWLIACCQFFGIQIILP